MIARVVFRLTASLAVVAASTSVPAHAQIRENRFVPEPNGPVHALAVQVDGKLLVGGDFTTVNGVPAAGIARLPADGSRDAGFSIPVAVASTAPALQGDGRLLVAGPLADGGGAGHGVVRYSLADAAVQRLETQGRIVRWRRSGASPELAAPPKLFVSANGITYLPAGTMQRVGDAWEASGLQAVPGQPFWLRAEGRISQAGGSSMGAVRSTLRTALIERIFEDRFE